MTSGSDSASDGGLGRFGSFSVTREELRDGEFAYLDLFSEDWVRAVEGALREGR